MPPEGDATNAGSTSGGSGDSAGQGGTGGSSPPKGPPRVFVDGRWMTAEEVASTVAQANQEKAELRGRLSVLEQQRSPVASPSLPDWAMDALDKGVPEAVVRSLVAAQAAGSLPSVDVRDVVRDELTSITRQARQAMSAADRARAEYVADHPDFNEAEMNQVLTSDPVVKDGYDTFYQGGKFYQAYDYAWNSRLSKGRAVNRQGRSAADVPPSRRLVQTREGIEGEPGEAPSRPKIPADVLEAAAIGGEDAVTAYMRHRRKGTALDLDSEPPQGWRGR